MAIFLGFVMAFNTEHRSFDCAEKPWSWTLVSFRDAPGSGPADLPAVFTTLLTSFQSEVMRV